MLEKQSVPPPILSETLRNLKKRGYHVAYYLEKQGLADRIAADILGDAALSESVGFGHLRSLEEIGLYERLKGSVAAIYRHAPPQSAPEDERLALQTDTHFLSANAVCRDGQIVNIDGTGNRIAASCFGPNHVVYVIGRNKIVDTLDEAIERAQQVSIMLSKENPKAAGLP